MISLALLQNIALLITLAVIHDRIMRSFGRKRRTHQILSGLLFGTVGVICMMTPLRFVPGVIFDGRSIILAIAGLFGGPVPAGISALMCGIYRIWLGGAGAMVGTLVALEAAGFGVLFHFLRLRNRERFGTSHLAGLGFLVHAIMVALLVGVLPEDASREVVAQIAIPVLLFYPPATVLIGLFFIDQERQFEAEKTLRDSEDRFRNAMDATNDGLWEWNVQTDKTYFNANYYSMLGYSSGEFEAYGKNWQSLIHPDDHERVLAANRDCIEGQTGQFQVEYRMKAKNGSYRWILGRGKAVTRDEQGKAVLMIGTHLDVTERKRAQEEKERLQEQLLHSQKMETVGRLAGGVAHDFNNMLGVIIGHADLALMNVDPESRIGNDLKEILKSAQRSADLTRQLLAFARKQTVAPRVIDLNVALGIAGKMFHRLIGEEVELSIQPAPDLWLTRLDPSQFDQLISNLLVNSRDAIHDKGTIRVETANVVWEDESPSPQPGRKKGEFVRITVHDSGSGMEQDVLAHLFEPFFTTKDVGKGTGLGLATVFGIVQQNQGFIEVESEPGKGTSFHVFLPRVVGEEPTALNLVPVEKLPRGSEHLLLVEDEEGILAIGKTILLGLGYSVVTFQRAADAVQWAETCTDQIDLLISDVVMPEMNGRDLAAKISARRPGLKVLYMSGYPADVIAPKGVLEMGVEFVAKPFSAADLAAQVRRLLDAKPLV